MKYLKSFFCIILVAVLLSGCSFKIASSVNDLVSSISPFGDNANIQKAMDNYAKNGYSLKAPSGGEFTTSYNFFDVDKDGIDEAISFYEPSDDLGTISMAILKAVNDEWQVVDSIKGIGKDVYKLEFGDIDNDKDIEILVCWNSISNSTNHTLSLYDVVSGKDGISVKKLAGDKSINDYIIVDFNNDNKNELLLFEINSGNYVSAKAEHYAISGKKYKLISETRLDSHISTYTNIKIENNSDGVMVYADALGSNGESMLTEIIYYSNRYKSIISPFYSYSTGISKGTSRKSLVPSYDINSDGLIEIPLDKPLKGVSKKVRVIDWKNYKSSILVHSCYSLYVKQESYSILIPDEYIDRIKVDFDSDRNELIVRDKDTKKPAFSVMPILKAVYNKKSYGDYEILLEDSGYYYLGKSVKNDSIKLSVDDLKKYIKCIND